MILQAFFITIALAIVPTDWNLLTCTARSYNESITTSGTICNCNCGVYDPDCDLQASKVLGCKGCQICGTDGNCITPNAVPNVTSVFPGTITGSQTTYIHLRGDSSVVWPKSTTVKFVLSGSDCDNGVLPIDHTYNALPGGWGATLDIYAPSVNLEDILTLEEEKRHTNYVEWTRSLCSTDIDLQVNIQTATDIIAKICIAPHPEAPYTDSTKTIRITGYLVPDNVLPSLTYNFSPMKDPFCNSFETKGDCETTAHPQCLWSDGVCTYVGHCITANNAAQCEEGKRIFCSWEDGACKDSNNTIRLTEGLKRDGNFKITLQMTIAHKQEDAKLTFRVMSATCLVNPWEMIASGSVRNANWTNSDGKTIIVDIGDIIFDEDPQRLVRDIWFYPSILEPSVCPRYRPSCQPDQPWRHYCRNSNYHMALFTPLRVIIKDDDPKFWSGSLAMKGEEPCWPNGIKPDGALPCNITMDTQFEMSFHINGMNNPSNDLEYKLSFGQLNQAGDGFVADTEHEIMDKQIVMRKGYQAIEFTIPDGKNPGEGDGDGSIWLTFKLTITSILDKFRGDAATKYTIWSTGKFLTQYDTEAKDSPIIWWIDTPTCRRKDTILNKNPEVEGCPTSSKYYNTLLDTDAQYGNCTNYTNMDDCHKDGFGRDWGCEWNGDESKCRYLQVPNTVQIIIEAPVGSDDKDGILNWYSNFRAGNCPPAFATDPVRTDEVCDATDNYIIEVMKCCLADTNQCFVVEDYGTTCNINTCRNWQADITEKDVEVWLAKEKTIFCIKELDYPQTAEYGQKCDILTQTCRYQYNCWDDPRCSNADDENFLATVKNMIQFLNQTVADRKISCRTDFECVANVKFTNVRTLEEKLRETVQNQGLGYLGGQTPPVTVFVQGCEDTACNLLNVELDWEMMKNLSATANDGLPIADYDENTPDKNAWLLFRNYDIIAIKGDPRMGQGERQIVEVENRMRRIERAIWSYAAPTIVKIQTQGVEDWGNGVSVGCPEIRSPTDIANCTRDGGYMFEIYGTNFGKDGARVFVGGLMCMQTVHGVNPNTELLCNVPSGTTTDERVWVMQRSGVISSIVGYLSYDQCPQGYAQAGLKCIKCTAGHFAVSINQDVCEKCPTGTFQYYERSSSCNDCVPGRYSDTAGSNWCKICEAGTFVDYPKAAECAECGMGLFTPRAGATFCYGCGLNSVSDDWKTDCICEPGYYASGREGRDLGYRVTCEICTEGMVCDLKGTFDQTVAKHNSLIQLPFNHPQRSFDKEVNYPNLVPSKDFMPMIHTTSSKRQMMACYDNEACLGGQPEQQCYKGYTGPLCADCEKNHGATAGYKCETCPPLADNIAALSAKIIISLIVVAYLIKTTIDGSEDKKSAFGTVVKIAFSFMQFNSLAAGFEYKYPPALAAILAVEEAGASITTGILSIDCFVQDYFDRSAYTFTFDPRIGCSGLYEVPANVTNSTVVNSTNTSHPDYDAAKGGIVVEEMVLGTRLEKEGNKELKGLPPYYLKSLLYGFVPLIIMLLCTLICCKFYTIKAKPEYECDQWKLSTKVLRRLSTMELPQDSKSYHYLNAWNNYITAIMMSFFLIYPSIVEQTFGMMKCKPLGVCDNDSFLIADMSVRCWTKNHWSWVILLAIPMLLVYVIGGPLFVFYCLYLNREELNKPFDQVNKSVLKRYHFLFKGYEPRFYYWELVVLGRKVAMVTISVFLSEDFKTQSLTATLLCVVVVVLHGFACPFESDTIDGLELLSLFGSFCTYFLGQFLDVEILPDSFKLFVTIAIGLMNFLVLFSIAMVLIGMASGGMVTKLANIKVLKLFKRNRNNVDVLKPRKKTEDYFPELKEQKEGSKTEG